MVPVFLSTNIAGSPTPFCALGIPPYSPKLKGSLISSQVCPLSVLLLKPTSTYSCRSALLLYLTSYTPNRVPLLEVTNPGILKDDDPSSPACLTPIPILRSSLSVAKDMGASFPSN